MILNTLMHWQLIFWDQVGMRQKCYTPQVRPTGVQTHDLTDYDSIFNFTETPALTTGSLVTSPSVALHSYNCHLFEKL